jgi:hypothetical protein
METICRRSEVFAYPRRRRPEGDVGVEPSAATRLRRAAMLP